MKYNNKNKNKCKQYLKYVDPNIQQPHFYSKRSMFYGSKAQYSAKHV